MLGLIGSLALLDVGRTEAHTGVKRYGSKSMDFGPPQAPVPRIGRIPATVVYMGDFIEDSSCIGDPDDGDENDHDYDAEPAPCGIPDMDWVVGLPPKHRPGPLYRGLEAGAAVCKL